MNARVRRPGHPMPEMAAFMAKLRSAFGDETVDEAVRRGKAGEPTFYACENGNSVGTASSATGSVWLVDSTIWNRQYCAGCDGGCVGQDVGCKEWLQRKAAKENS
ncbi:hypothetical protein [Paraburkholderia fungorum]|jgi:hypothetical protein|uniref:hypothetical protein n=1 Tax=Paraburkholderia fungorum TaxID=134537 RepID=UPI000DB2406A|nr:hypothetical protein [Paraburkholderia fungorum]MBU7438892.1 hypothetical protein [Paraburkholderia fungorum]PZR48331.1 MAG: hypothetical protein DI523_11460 [Paraburkholderia fungorum]QLD52357.1 hypothetical protein C9419_25930 [Paraburkholderia fungorum]